jgi:hypothetical protein
MTCPRNVLSRCLVLHCKNSRSNELSGLGTNDVAAQDLISVLLNDLDKSQHAIGANAERKLTNFTKPSESWLVFARELAAKGNLPILYLTPACLSSSSFLPTQATSGWV